MPDLMPDPMPLLDSDRVKTEAASLGFELAGIASIDRLPDRVPEVDFYSEWLDRGYAGEMRYLGRRVEERSDPRRLLSGVRSIIVCGANYHTDRPLTRLDPLRAWISRYAWGDDYHAVLKDKLERLADWIRTASGGETRTYVDTGPVIERIWARYAGVGWFGKNTCIIDEDIGSWTFIGCILTDLELAADRPAPDRCGTCTACIDACPTGAILEPYVLDSRRCISYLTIELRGPIPEDLRDGVGHHLFGCDICQDVCPWNRRAPVTREPAFQAREGLFWPNLEDLLELDDDGWRDLVRGTAIKRARIRGLIRNLMVVVGNSGVTRLADKLVRFLSHPDPDVRTHAGWAWAKLLGRREPL